MSDRDDLEIILRSHYPLITVNTFEEARTVNLFKTIAPRVELPLSTWTVTDGLNAIVGDATFNPSELRLVGDSPAETTTSTTDPEYALRVIRNAKQAGLILLLDFHPYLTEPVNIRLIKEIAQDHDVRRQKLIFVSHAISLPPELVRFSASFNLRLPNVNQIGRIVTEESAIWAAQRGGEGVRVDREAVNALLTNLTGLTDTDARQMVRNAIRDDGAISGDDVLEIVEAKRTLVGQQGLLSFEYDTAHLSDIGGFDNLKQWLEQRRTQFAGTGGPDTDRPKGLMLLGVQGGGKSLAAKAVAGIWSVPLLRLDFGVLYNKFFGETERNMREGLQTAETMAPCVLWCDEIEKGISTGDYDSGTSKRLLGTLLTWMAENDKQVFIVATANDVTALPPELIRKGRPDEIFFIDLPGPAVRSDIFSIHLKKRELDPARFDLEAMVAASEGFTGAEIEQAIVATCYAASANDTTASTELVLNELANTKPLSVVRAEDINRLRQWADGRTVMA